MRAAQRLLLVAVLTLGAGIVIRDSLDSSAAPLGPVVFYETFARPDGMVTNAWAHWNDGDPRAREDGTWRATSGTLFVDDGRGWTGPPDPGKPDPESATANGSAVFRLRTQRMDFGDAKVGLRLRVRRFLSTPRTPPVDWDGAHIWLRYQNPQHLYVASVARRNGAVAIKKKCPGGSANGGTYYTLASAQRTFPLKTWSRVAASSDVLSDGSVQLRLYRDGVVVADAVDDGVGCPPIVAPGAVGLRGDNAALRFDNFTVRQLLTEP